MASLGNAEVAYFDQSEFSAAKEQEPTSYDAFVYDNESDGGILEVFDESKQKVQLVKDNINAITSTYQHLQGLYDSFTNYNETMNAISSHLTTNGEWIEEHFKNIVDSAQQAVAEHQKVDETLMDDLEALNDLLGKDNGADWSRSDASFVSN